jgi:polysaccharide chain length determinant protein (PEP-CTERM system associated)
MEELESSLRDLLSRFTGQHPEVIALRRKLQALREARESERPSEPGQAPAGVTQGPESSDEPASGSAAFESLKIDLAQQETDIAFYRGRIARITDRIGELESAVVQIPEVEAELTRLNRDYEVLRSKYQDLVNRREQANISRERDIRSRDIKFRILEPPRVPGSPTGPSRSLLLAVSLVGGIGAGVVFALLLGLLSDAVSDPEQLRKSFGLPILGMVSTIDNFKNHSLRVAQLSAFFAGIAMLFVVFAGLVMVERQSGLANLRSNEHINAAYEGVGAASGKLKAVIAELIERI